MPREKTPETKTSATSVAAYRGKPQRPKMKVTAAPANAPVVKANMTTKPVLVAPTPVAKAMPVAKASPKPAKGKPTGVTRSILNLNSAMNRAVTFDQIAERAYFRWMERGCPFGSPEEDWLRAEQELELLR